MSRLLIISITSLDLSVFSRHNLPRIKYEACVINLDDKKSKGNIRKGNKWNIINNVSLFIDRNSVV